MLWLFFWFIMFKFDQFCEESFAWRDLASVSCRRNSRQTHDKRTNNNWYQGTTCYYYVCNTTDKRNITTFNSPLPPLNKENIDNSLKMLPQSMTESNQQTQSIWTNSINSTWSTQTDHEPINHIHTCTHHRNIQATHDRCMPRVQTIIGTRVL
jgi:hypothetical protein